MILFVLVVAAATFFLMRSDRERSISTFLPFVQDDDEGVSQRSYTPIQGDKTLEVTVSFKNASQAEPEISIQDLKLRQTAQEVPRSVGSYYFNLYNEQGDWLDAVFFSLPTSLFTTSGDELGTDTLTNSEIERQSGSVNVLLPLSGEVSRVVLQSVEDGDLQLDVPFQDIVNQQQDVSDQSLTMSSSTCQDPLYAGDGDGHFVVQACTNFDTYPEAAEKFKEFYLVAKENFPELVFFPINEVFLGNTTETSTYCDLSGVTYGCFFASGQAGLNATLPTVMQGVAAHEFGHGVLFRNKIIATLNPNDPAYPALEYQMQQFADYINSQRAEDWQCQFTYKEETGQPQYGKTEFNLYKDWYAENQDTGRDGYLQCDGVLFCAWNDLYIEHPVTRQNAPYNERPGDPGVVSSYGQLNYHEELAEIYASLYKGVTGIGVPNSLHDIFTQFDPNQAVCGEEGVNCSTAGLQRDISILGSYCIVEDADHDGVVDSADTCAPKIDCPNNAAACYNPDQIIGESCSLSDNIVNRIAGEDRYETAIEVSKQNYPTEDSAGGVVVAYGGNFPAALSAAPLAYQLNAPILLSEKLRLPINVLQEIERVLPSGGAVTLVGGTSVLSQIIENDLVARGYAVSRVAGVNRIESSIEVARLLNPSDQLDVFIAYADNFPAAMTVSSEAARSTSPILLNGNQALNAQVQNFLSEKYDLGQLRNIYIVGGYAVLSENIEESLTTLFPDTNIIRFSGENRFHSAELVARYFFTPETTSSFGFAYGLNFPAALIAGPYLARAEAPILLVKKDAIPDEIASYSGSVLENNPGIYLFGGEAVITAENEEVIRNLFR